MRGVAVRDSCGKKREKMQRCVKIEDDVTEKESEEGWNCAKRRERVK